MATGRDVLKFVFNLDIPLVNGRVPFHRTVYELVRNVSETQIPEVTAHTVTSAMQSLVWTRYGAPRQQFCQVKDTGSMLCSVLK